LEITNLYRDRAEHDKEQAQARKEELDSFKTIARGTDTAIQQSQRQFEATITRLDSSPSQERTTLLNTMPRAVLILAGFGITNVSSYNVGGQSSIGPQYQLRK
jgi:hypothetical protein